jgi:hypothetical protein
VGTIGEQKLIASLALLFHAGGKTELMAEPAYLGYLVTVIVHIWMPEMSVFVINAILSRYVLEFKVHHFRPARLAFIFSRGFCNSIL